MTPAAMRAIARLHRWLGLTLALPLAVLALSGALLLFKDALWVPADWRAGALTQAEVDSALARTLAADARWVWVDVAGPGRAFHTLGDAGDARAYVRAGEVSAGPSPPGLGIEHTLFRLHEQLLSGTAGKAAVRVIGPLAALLLLLGMLAWWPRRRAWRAAHLREVSASRPALLRFHMAWGAAALLVLLPLVFSGALLAHNPGIRAWLRQYQPTAAALPASVEALRYTPADFAGALAAARSIWPDGRLTQLSRAAPGAAVLTLKFRLPGERHPNGRSTLTLDLAGGRVLSAYDARTGGAPAAYDDVLYAFHTGRLFRAAQAPLWLAGAAVLVALLASGALAWARSRRPASR